MVSSGSSGVNLFIDLILIAVGVGTIINKMEKDSNQSSKLRRDTQKFELEVIFFLNLSFKDFYEIGDV